MAVGSKTLTAFNAAANGTDVSLVTALSGRQICVVAVAISSVAGSSTTFNSKGSGAGTAISGSLSVGANGGFVLAETTDWFRTNQGEALTVTTTAATSITVAYRVI